MVMCYEEHYDRAVERVRRGQDEVICLQRKVG